MLFGCFVYFNSYCSLQISTTIGLPFLVWIKHYIYKPFACCTPVVTYALAFPTPCHFGISYENHSPLFLFCFVLFCSILFCFVLFSVSFFFLRMYFVQVACAPYFAVKQLNCMGYFIVYADHWSKNVITYWDCTSRSKVEEWLHVQYTYAHLVLQIYVQCSKQREYISNFFGTELLMSWKPNLPIYDTSIAVANS